MMLGNKIVYSNIAITNILGYSAKELTSISINELFTKDSINNNGYNLFSDFLKSDKDNLEIETSLYKIDKQIVDVNLNASQIMFGDKKGTTITIRDISKDKKIEEELEQKTEQFKSLTKNIDIGVFRTTFDNRARFIEANPATLQVLGFSKNEELFKNNIFDLFINTDEKKTFFKELIHTKKIKNRVIKIQKHTGEQILACVSITIVNDSNSNNNFCDGVIEDVTFKKQSEEQREQVFNELQASQFFMNQSIKMFAREIIKCSIDTSIIKAASLMNKHQRGAILIETNNNCIGILTDSDLRKRVVAKGVDLTKPVSEIMTAPIITIKESAFIFEAVILMHENKLRNLCVKNHNNEITHILSSEELRQLQVQSSSFIIKDINSATDVEEIVQARQNLHLIVNSMIKSGANTKIITGVMASVFDLITNKLVNFAIDDLGTPPTKFAFVGLGSEGRGEETLLTDQDNAIIYQDVEENKQEEAKAYFDKLSTKVCDWLHEIGYTYCIGNIMAKNTKWCQPLSVWQTYFTKWISTAKPQDLLEINIFFDYRTIYGDTDITNNLRNHIEKLTKVHPQFFIFMAQNTLLYKPPLNVFGNIVLESKGKKDNTFSVKEALVPIVSFARIYSIQNNISQTNTLERLHVLYNNQTIKSSSYNEIKHAYNYLMQLRLKHQISLIDKNKEVNNDINPKELTNIDRSMIKKVLLQIQNFQTKLSYDFKGGR